MSPALVRRQLANPSQFLPACLHHARFVQVDRRLWRLLIPSSSTHILQLGKAQDGLDELKPVRPGEPGDLKSEILKAFRIHLFAENVQTLANPSREKSEKKYKIQTDRLARVDFVQNSPTDLTFLL